MNEQYAEIIRNILTAEEIIKGYGFEADERGFCLCPFHNEKTPSMKVYKNSYYCFGCGAGGDVFEFVKQLFGISFSDAVAKINEDFKLNLPIGQRPTLRQQKAYEKLIRESERKRREAKELREQRFNDYCDLIAQYTRLCKWVVKYKPKSPNEEISPYFIEAKKQLPHIAERLNNFEFGTETEMTD